MALCKSTSRSQNCYDLHRREDQDDQCECSRNRPAKYAQIFREPSDDVDQRWNGTRPHKDY